MLEKSRNFLGLKKSRTFLDYGIAQEIQTIV
jgi:hypothetical protein